MQPLAQAIPRAIAVLLAETKLTPGKVDFAWKATVGSALERVTSVRLEHGVLLVEATSPAWAREVRRSSPIILRRLQALLGANVVKSLDVRK